jgi:hypothetical protein
MLNLTKIAALLAFSASAAFVPVRMDVQGALSNSSDLFQVSRACASESEGVIAPGGQEVVGCEPAPGYVCKLDNVQYIDKKPIIINTN